MANSILEGKKLISPVKRLKPGYDIKYLLLIKIPNSDENYWEIIEGREEVYNYIKNNIDIIDVDESFIIANKMKEIDLDKMHTIYGFVKFVKEENNIVDEFDIDDYMTSRPDNSSFIGIGLESAGQVFTGVAGSYESAEDEE